MGVSHFKLKQSAMLVDNVLTHFENDEIQLRYPDAPDGAQVVNATQTESFNFNGATGYGKNLTGYMPVFGGKNNGIELNFTGWSLKSGTTGKITFSCFVDEAQENDGRSHFFILGHDYPNEIWLGGRKDENGIYHWYWSSELSVSVNGQNLTYDESEVEFGKTLTFDVAVSNASNDLISVIGGYGSVSYRFHGWIWDLSFFDDSNPKNCRYYPLINWSEDKPTSKLVKDHLFSPENTPFKTPNFGENTYATIPAWRPTSTNGKLSGCDFDMEFNIRIESYGRNYGGCGQNHIEGSLHMGYYTSGDGRVFFEVGQTEGISGTTKPDGTPWVKTNQDYHWKLEVRGNNVSMYVDGELACLNTINDVDCDITKIGDSLLLGRTDSYRWFSGKVWDFKITDNNDSTNYRHYSLKKYLGTGSETQLEASSDSAMLIKSVNDLTYLVTPDTVTINNGYLNFTNSTYAHRAYTGTLRFLDGNLPIKVRYRLSSADSSQGDLSFYIYRDGANDSQQSINLAHTGWQNIIIEGSEEYASDNKLGFYVNTGNVTASFGSVSAWQDVTATLSRADWVDFHLGDVTDGVLTEANWQNADVLTAPEYADFYCKAHTDFSLVLTRQDYSYLEFWDEAILTEDGGDGLVFPLGSVQFESSSYDGIDGTLLSTLSVGVGYSQFGSWDSGNTRNHYAWKWSDLTPDQKKTILSDPKHHLRLKDGKLVQRRYRSKTAVGLGNDWRLHSPYLYYSDQHALGYNDSHLIKPQCSLTSAESDFILDRSVSHVRFGSHRSPTNHICQRNVGHSVLETSSSSNSVDDLSEVAFGGWGLLMPLALTQRVNKGSWHPYLNPWGTSGSCTSVDSKISGASWQNTNLIAKKPIHCLRKFKYGSTDLRPANYDNSGDYNSGSSWARPRLDSITSFNGILDTQVQDLRIGVDLKSIDELKKQFFRDCTRSLVRGKDSLPITRIQKITGVSQHTELTDYSNTTRLVFKSLLKSEAPLLNGTSAPDEKVYPIWVVKKGESKAYQVFYSDLNASDLDSYLYIHKTFETDWLTATSEFYVVDNLEKDTAQFNQLPMAEWIGSPEKILEEANVFSESTKNLVELVGSWNPTVPDGTTQDFHFTRKVVGSPLKAVYKTNGNYTVNKNWISSTTFPTPENKYSYNEQSDLVLLGFYKADGKFTQPSEINTTSYEVIDGDISEFYATQDHNNTLGNRLHYSLLETIGKNGYSQYRHFYGSLTEKGRFDGNKYVHNGHFDTDIGFFEQTSNYQNDTDGLVAQYWLFENKGLIWCQIVGLQLFFSNNQWGVIGEIPYRWENTLHYVTDANSGKSAKVAFHCCQFPIGIARK